MQYNEELIKQITEEVVKQLNDGGKPSKSSVNSLAGKDRINEKKTSYADYPKAFS